MRKQPMRHSQFITTFGPGALVETRYGPRIITVADRGLFLEGFSLLPRDLEIPVGDELRFLLGDRARVHGLPPSSSGQGWITKSVFSWALCVKDHEGCQVLHRITQTQTCPLCNSRSDSRNAIRFVLACPAGHLDDVDWMGAVHKDGPRCDVEYLLWKESGTAMALNRIICPRCKSRKTLRDLYIERYSCTGRLPERDQTVECTRKAAVVQRQASYIRIAEVYTIIRMPPSDTILGKALLGEGPRAILKVLTTQSRILDPEEVASYMERASYPDVAGMIRENPDEFRRLLEEGDSPKPRSLADVLEREWEVLREGSEKGHPPEPRRDILLEIRPSDILRNVRFGKLRLRIAAVRRLQAVMVQRGYRREVGGEREPAKVVDISFERDGFRWYPGVEVDGEAIFIRAEDDCTIGIPEDAGGVWKRAEGRAVNISAWLFRDPENRIEHDPLFIFWHSFAHAVIRHIAMRAGYPEASLRERVYLKRDRTEGGVLLCALLPGEGGALGGLLSIVRRGKEFFEKGILEGVLRGAGRCSNDPLCLRGPDMQDPVIGAACHACLLIPETSCEHRNLWLDRRVLLAGARL